MRLLSNADWARRRAAVRDETAGGLRRAAALLGITRARLPLAVVLSLTFGLMLMAALAIVLGLAFYAGTANTRELLADRTNLLLDTLEGRVESLLRPVEEQLRAVASEITDGDLEPEPMMTRGRALRGILATTPQVVGMAFVRPDFRAFRFLRTKGSLPPEDWSGLEPIRRAFEHAAGDAVVWGAPAWSANLQQTVINAHIPVRRDGQLLGLLFAAVTLDTVVRRVDEISAGIGQPVFVLQGRDAVVALPRLDTSIVGPDHPLPLLPEAGDPVLAAMWAGSQANLDVLGEHLRGAVRLVEATGDRWVVLYREIAGFGDQPWVVGTYLPASVAGAEIRRLWYAGLLSLACIAVAVAATFWLGRRMARPVEKLAEAAAHIQALDLDAVPLLPRSHVRELDRAARAFNAMRNGLAWFETYVPRRLVRQLMDNPSPEVVASRQLEVTVLFTDIVGFSRLAEQLDAGEAASLLNRHFELLAGCVAETEGTVDKFLGDGMMAFWGAPLPQPDHALRAVRAALLIRDRLAEARGFPPLRLRLGIHTGTALVGNIGSSDRLNYTLVGDTVNIAQRLEQLGKEIAPDDGIVILASGTTAAHAAGLCRIEPLGPRQLRGRDETVEVFRLC
ncbi:adenylate/guanylate cyclase domain-containing protein [Benzoatithermus flavus]|uniref:Adenylate/guanylate cyclase domain-containing protein n=1 Tax=Benzoatithermus flavus TaxID=3108223 RepID=A0ABU8XZM2_9PROT